MKHRDKALGIKMNRTVCKLITSASIGASWLAASSALAGDTGYQPMSVRDFIIDGPQLVAENAHVQLTGAYTRLGNVAVLFENGQAVAVAKFVPNVPTPPSIPLLTDAASHRFRELLYNCDASMRYACLVEVRGQATTCTMTNGFGAAHDAPCIAVDDGEQPGPTPSPQAPAPQTAPLQPTPTPTPQQQVQACAAKPSALARCRTQAAFPTDGANGSASQQQAYSPPAAALPADDLAVVSAHDPQAAQHIAAYCESTTEGARNPIQAAAWCRRDEVNAWMRIAVKHEPVPSQCSGPPWPDSYVAKETCAHYYLHTN